MKNKKTLKLLILLILSIILFYVINTYAMNYNGGSYTNDFLVYTLSRYMRPVPILFIGYLLYMILEPLIKEPLKKYLPLIYVFLTSVSIFYLVIRFF